MTTAWGPQQAAALKAVNDWYREFKLKKGKGVQPVFSLHGYAGTGKTTLARHFAEFVDGEVLYAAFTGKAAMVMRNNGCPTARTIHSLIYIGDEDPKTGEVTWRVNRNGSALNEASLLIVDECSMVNAEMGKDLLSFGCPILALGDPGQLPPVSGSGFFSDMKPDAMLTEIHRQAKDSPIIYLATLARQGEPIEVGEYDGCVVTEKLLKSDLLSHEQMLCGRNVTRVDMNKRFRKLLKFDEDLPQPGERLICLKNDKDLKIFNGGLFIHKENLAAKSKYETSFLKMLVDSVDEDRENIRLRVHKSFFSDDVPVPDWRILKGSQEADYSYCLSVHKSQGSQFGSVLILDESYCFREDRNKHLYTAITRAVEKLTLVINR